LIYLIRNVPVAIAIAITIAIGIGIGAMAPYIIASLQFRENPRMWKVICRIFDFGDIVR
jgi:hypothetical protein